MPWKKNLGEGRYRAPPEARMRRPMRVRISPSDPKAHFLMGFLTKVRWNCLLDTHSILNISGLDPTLFFSLSILYR